MSVEKSDQVIFLISNKGEATLAKRRVRSFALDLGFADDLAEKLAIVVAELASNLLKHVGEGHLLVSRLREGEQFGIEIESVDQGPGLSALGDSFADGFSTAGTLGNGLGSINRIMDDLEMLPGHHKGLRIIARKWIHRPGKTAGLVCPFDIGVASRPHPKMSVNGDNFLVRSGPDFSFACVIDGVGHGQFAFKAAISARNYLEGHFHKPMTQLFQGAARACASTRGAVMAALTLDWRTHRISFASVGNIEIRVKGPKSYSFIHRRGVVGSRMPPFKPQEEVWEPGTLMVLFSDGIRTSWTWDEFADLYNEPSSKIASAMLNKLARDNDDATVMVIKDKKS
ncbi:MAG: hypothetical protein RRB13_12190 [bacterium]|nr:hypothetical protein [bacterium]